MEHKYNKGSEWRKWDLHIHSNASDGRMTPEEIIDKSITKGLSVIALTDHHTAENIDKIKSLGDEKGIKVISGIEFRTEYGSKSVHMIGLFPDEFNGIILGSQSLHDLILSPLGLSKTAIIAKGREKNTSSTTEKAFEDGMFLLQVDFKEASKLIRTYGGIISVHAGSKANSFEQEIKHQGSSPKNVSELYDSLGTLKEELLKDYIDICEINRVNDSEAFYFNTFNKPSIVASDAHVIDEIGAKYTWIKADTTFEGLKQILCEPRERCKIQIEHPEDKKSYNIIEKIKFVDTSGQNKFSCEEIGLSSGLNAIIGGKSSGKSLLLHMVASEMGNKTDIKNYQDLTKNTSIEIYYKDDPAQKRTKDDARIIEFLPQLHIENLVRNQEHKTTTYRSLNEFIENLIKQDESIKTIFETSNSIITEAISNIESAITEWGKLDAQLNTAKEERVKLGDKKAIENEIERIIGKIDELTKNAGWTPEEKTLYDKLIADNQIQEVNKKALEQTNEEYRRFEDYIINQVSNDIDNAIRFASVNDAVNGAFAGFKGLLNKSLAEIITFSSSQIKENIQKNIGSLDAITTNITANIDVLKPLMAKNAIQAEVAKLEQLKKEEEKRLTTIAEKELYLAQLRQNITGLNFVANYTIIENSYKSLSTKLNTAIADKWNIETTKLDIRAKAVFNNTVFVNSINDIINMKSYLSNQFGNDIFDINEYNYNVEYHKNNISKLVDFSIKESDRFSNFKQGKTTKELLFAILKNCFTIEYDIKKGTDSIHSMSEGKKGIVILQLYLSLSQSDCPILIDQPEDNLDNRTVYQDLNDYIKQCKRKRQIIMVSHNANLVVNTDAENIIVANQTGENGSENRKYKFEYVNGSLENTFTNNKETAILYKQGIREHACEILEGGVDAFKKRENKYHIMN